MQLVSGSRLSSSSLMMEEEEGKEQVRREAGRSEICVVKEREKVVMMDERGCDSRRWFFGLHTV